MYTSWRNDDNRAIAAMIRPEGGLINLFNKSTANITDTALYEVVPAPGDLLKNYVQNGLVTNASATGTWVNIKDGTGNLLFTGYAGPGNGFLVPGIFTTETANSNISIQCETAGAEVRTTLIGYISQS